MAAVLMLFTGPTMRETVRWQIQSLVSNRAIIESAPPVARYRPVGESSTVRQDAECPFNMNSVDSPGLTAWLTWRTGSSSGYDRIRILPSLVGMKTFSPLQQKAIWFVSTGCWCDETTADLAGDTWKSSPFWETQSQRVRGGLMRCAMAGQTHPVPDKQRGAVRGPGKRVGGSEALDLVDACLCPHVPELDNSVAADAAELCVLDRVEGDLLDPSGVALELG